MTSLAAAGKTVNDVLQGMSQKKIETYIDIQKATFV